ncbi:MAG TPA: ATP-binding cassette domain-containing protein [Vicinamibacterales bacterium]|nr:ATP-binding cassette domain-containing protein [Vicinamibacterales bacterium]
MEAAHRVTMPIVQLLDLHLRRGVRTVLDGVSAEIGRGEIVALMGASGSGKTTLLRTIAGLEPFERGAIAVDGVTLGPGLPAAATLRSLRSKVGMIFQFHCLFEHLSAVENVSLAQIHVHRVGAAAAAARSEELLGQLGVAHRARALPRELSGGEAQRVAIARALATDPPVLLMDEPTASLDPGRRDELAAIVRDLVTRGRTIIAATHDEDFAGAAATRVIRMHEGRVSGRAADG